MNENSENGLTREEREAFDSLARAKQPPAYLEELVIASLEGSGLLGVRPPWRQRTPRVLVQVAAALLLFVLGALVGAKWWTESSESNMPQFMLALKTDAGSSRSRTPEEIRSRVAEYSHWARELRQLGVLVDGEKLKQEARVLGEVHKPQSPEGENQKTFSGYFLISARDYDDAVRIASGCPHLRYGGTIEVRQIDR
jgi:hypothetical protein